MTFTFSKNLFIRFYCWFENCIIRPIKNHYYRNKKTHYQCWICGKIEAPYFKEGELCAPITDGYGWHKIDKNRWICHHCDAHGFSDSSTIVPREQREPTWDEWQEYVRTSNEKVLSLIKEKDPEYYEERELFESEDEDDE